MEHVIDCEADVMLLSETWLKSKRNDVTAAVSQYGYTLHHCNRNNRAKVTGGGVGVLVKKCLDAKLLKVKQYQTFEHCVVKINLIENKWVTFISIYRLDYEAIDHFFTEFTELLELHTVTEKCIIAGDINIHCDVTDDRYTMQFNNLLTAFNLSQFINKPTHKKGHTLDVVIACSEEVKVHGVEVNNIELSDHYLLSFSASCTAPRSYYKTITYRKKVDHDEFSDCLVEVLNNIPISNSFSETICEYNDRLSALVENKCPKVTKEVKIVDEAPWFDNDYKELRKERRRAERKFKRSGDEVDHIAFKDLRKKTTLAASEKKKEHYVAKIQNANNKPKMLFSVVKTLMDAQPMRVLPTSTSDTKLANDFLTYFREKIAKIRELFPPAKISTESHPPGNIKFSTFERATEEEIHGIVKAYGVSCSPEDPIPIKILSDHVDTLVPLWLELVNLSLSTGSMDCVKSAVIGPLLKEADEMVDIEVFKNFRPVSNLVFLSKLIERCVATRLNKHMKDNKLESKNEFGYKVGHSTELLLVKVVDGLLTVFDKKKATVLLLLDLSAAFDTVDQNKLLHILRYDIGLNGTVYKWFESFIKGRSQRVKIGESYSDVDMLLYGLAQGSVLGPPLFNIYIRSLYPYIQALNYNIEGFADDHQIFKSFLPVFQVEVLGQGINDCLKAVEQWMNEFFLKLNKTKTKILVLAPLSIMASIIIHGTFVENQCIRFVSCAKNLGVWLDENLNFSFHIRKVVSSAFMVIRAISKIKYFLPKECLCTIVCSLVLSKLDYCNALYYGINNKEIALLQSVQNAAIRLIGGGRKYDRESLTPLYNELHWLRISERVVFKLCLIVHKCVWGLGPESYDEMIVMKNSRTLKLVEKKFETGYGKRSFSCAGPKLWNCLPMNVREEKDTENFKKRLKSLLMMEADDFYSRVNIR